MRAFNVRLREVEENDIPIFFEQQRDLEASQMAGFPSRGEEQFHAHWHRIRSDETNILRTILFEGKVAGNIVSWEQDEKRLIGYWIGRKFWGKGIATRALAEFLSIVKTRPLHAYVVKHNTGSIHVLEKNGFSAIAAEKQTSMENGKETEELHFKLN
jgi:RimJ/RimL family protein N-acetyltransferase